MNIKKVIKGNALHEYCEKALDLLCDTVAMTLGPQGSNAIIDHSCFSPFITNDGVTIAKNIESDNEIINTIFTLAKEASIKTDEEAGDGTTTTLVLLNSIYKNGLSKINEGYNPQIVKKELDKATKDAINLLKTYSRKPNPNDYKLVASIAANDEEIGLLLSQTYLKLNCPQALKIKESSNGSTYIKITKGYTFDSVLASPYFLVNQDSIVLNDAKTLIINAEINNINYISELINYLIKENKPAVILAKDYSDLVVNEILSLNFAKKTNIILLKFPEYGTHQIDTVNDIKLLTNSKIINNEKNIDLNALGKTNSIQITNNSVHIHSKKDNANITKIINSLKAKIKNTQDEYELEFLYNRLAKLTKGAGIIYVGGNTITEAREKKMRFDDALFALENINEGILPGAGLSFLKVSHHLINKSIGYDILINSLDKPFKKILENVGLDSNKIFLAIEKSNYSQLYNVNTDKYELVTNTKVIDPIKVVINTLKNASSIASILLTTNALIINEHNENKSKILQFAKFK